MDKVEPIVLSYEDGQEYVIEFSRATCAQAEKDGVDINKVESEAMNIIPKMFYWGLKMHHPTISRKKAEEILFDDIGGISEKLMSRLAELYAAPYNSLINKDDSPKNPKLTVNL